MIYIRAFLILTVSMALFGVCASGGGCNWGDAGMGWMLSVGLGFGVCAFLADCGRRGDL